MAEDYASESVQVDLINDIDNLSCNNLPFSIPEEVINEIKTESKELISEGKIQPSQNGKEYAFPLNHANKLLIVKIQNTGLTVCKPLECLNYNVYSLCSHIVAVAQNTGNLGMIIEHAHKKTKPVKLPSLTNFGRPCGSGTKIEFKRIRNRKNISGQTNVLTLYPSNALAVIVPDHATNSSEMLPEKSTAPPKKLCKTEPLCSINQNECKQKNEGNELNISKKKPSPLETSRRQLSKLSNFVNVEKQNPVPLGKSLGPTPPQPEPQMQQYELIIRNGKISRCKGCLNEFDRKNPKLCIVGRNEYDWYVNVNKQENTKIYKLRRQSRYYCTRKQCNVFWQEDHSSTF